MYEGCGRRRVEKGTRDREGYEGRGKMTRSRKRGMGVRKGFRVGIYFKRVPVDIYNDIKYLR